MSVLEAELWLKIKTIGFQAAKLSASYRESRATIFQSVNVIFLTLKR